MKISRYFTKDKDPYRGLKFKSCLVEGKPVEIIEGWSDLATSIVVKKYFRKTGVPDKKAHVKEEGVPEWLARSTPAPDATLGSETSIKQPVERMAGTWTYWGWKNKYFDSEEDARAFYDELRYILINQIAAPNSPQWFNTGLHWAYGISTKPTGCQYYVDPKTNEVVLSELGYERPQPHACFILSIEDKLVGPNGIQDQWHKEAVMFKYGSGVGTNFSNIRATNEPLSGGGFSSGLPSFLTVGDRSAGAIKSGGTTRRAAKMVIVDIDHPDVPWFVSWKRIEDEKVAAMIAGSTLIRNRTEKIAQAFASNSGLEREIAFARYENIPESYIQRLLLLLQQGLDYQNIAQYTDDWQGEAYRTVSGQNANNSVRLTDEFMRKVETNGDFALLNRTDGSIARTVKARELWDEIAYNAWASAEPGVQYHDTINSWHTCPQDGPIRASNPCSEYMFLDDTACNLASMNLVKFMQDGKKFDIKGFEHVCQLLTIVLELSVVMAQFPSEKIARRSEDFRTLGLGHANIGGLLMRMGIPYDSQEAFSIARTITAAMTGVAYKTSALIAKEQKPFNGFEKNKKDMMRVMRNHKRAAAGLATGYEELNRLPPEMSAPKTQGFADLWDFVQKIWDEVILLGEKYGFRNAQVTVIAPTGTIALVMDCDTTGGEPEFALVKIKIVIGGGYVKIVNQSVPIALKSLGYSDQQIAEIGDYILGVGEREIDFDLNADYSSTRRAPINAKSISAQISGEAQKEMLGHMRKWVNGHSTTGQFIAACTLNKVQFTKTDFDESERFYLGSETIEGAPHIKESDIPVFDCANKCGKWGKRSLSWKAHIGHLIAIQPVLSGAISKTVNLPQDATIQDCAEAYKQSELGGVKAVALYRDGSKSQPLMTSQHGVSTNISKDLMDAFELEIYKFANQKAPISSLPGIFSGAKTLKRRQLPHLRKGVTQKVYIGGHKFLIRTGEYPDGTLGEIFIDTHKEGATFRSLMNGFAMLFSLALQHGVSLKELVNMYRGMNFEPHGPVVGHEKIKFASSIFSFVVEHLAYLYLQKEAIYTHNTLPEEQEALPDQDKCPTCYSSALIVSGTCKVCTNCGESAGGCS